MRHGLQRDARLQWGVAKPSTHHMQAWCCSNCMQTVQCTKTFKIPCCHLSACKYNNNHANKLHINGILTKNHAHIYNIQSFWTQQTDVLATLKEITALPYTGCCLQPAMYLVPHCFHFLITLNLHVKDIHILLYNDIVICNNCWRQFNDQLKWKTTGALIIAD